MADIRPMGLLAAWLHVPPEREDEFNAWCNTEHIQQITSIPGFIDGRRYVASVCGAGGRAEVSGLV
jgi:hypothetical protein